MKVGGAQWKNILPAQRAKWDQLFEAENEGYQKSMEQYVASGKKDAWQRDPLKPKVPMTGCLRFLGDFRQKNPTLKVTEAAQAGSKEWKAMSEAQQKPYNEKYLTEKKAYTSAMEAYRSSGKEAAWEKKVGIADVKAKELAKKEALVAKKTAAVEKKKLAAEKLVAKKKAVVEKKKAQLLKAKAATAAKKVAEAGKKKATDEKQKAQLLKAKAVAAANKAAIVAKTAATNAKKKAVAVAKKATVGSRTTGVSGKKASGAAKK